MISYKITHHQIDLVQKSLLRLIPISETAIDIFCENLFRLDPSLKPSLSRTLNRYPLSIINVTYSIISELENAEVHQSNIEMIVNIIRDNNIKEENFTVIRNAIPETLIRLLRSAYNEETGEAWEVVCRMLEEGIKNSISVIKKE